MERLNAAAGISRTVTHTTYFESGWLWAVST